MTMNNYSKTFQAQEERVSVDFVNNDPTFQIYFAEDLVNDVCNTYLKHLNLKRQWLMKLSYVCVSAYFVQTQSTGYIWPILEEKLIKIILEFNPNQSKKYLAFIVAHELAHLLMCEINDIFSISGKVSTIKRLANDNEVYGSKLEELLADYLAHYIVSKMDYEDETGEYAEMAKKNAAKYNFVANLESYFGESLMKSDFIDFTIEKMEDEEGATGEYNAFWYCIATNNFDMIIDELEKNMKKNMESQLADVDPSKNVGNSRSQRELENYLVENEEDDGSNAFPIFFEFCEKIDEFFANQDSKKAQAEVNKMLLAREM